MSFFLVPETKYDRPLSAYQGQGARVSTFVPSGEDSPQKDGYLARRLSTKDVREMDLVNYKPRTLASDMRLFVNKPDWAEGYRTVRRICTVFFFPDIFWAFVSFPASSPSSPVSNLSVLNEICLASERVNSWCQRGDGHHVR